MDSAQKFSSSSTQETRNDLLPIVGSGPTVQVHLETPETHINQPQIVREDPEKDEEEGEEEKKDSPDGEKKGGRRKINIEFIENKSRRHVTFSKRKAGLIKKAYELSTLTGTQVLLLVASETGNVYTFATPKLQPLITKPEGKTLIQACLNPPEVTDIPHQQSSSNLPQRMPSEAHSSVYAEKKNSSSYQSKEGLQMWAPLQERLMKESAKGSPGSGPGLSELGANFTGYSTTSSSNNSTIVTPSAAAYSQYTNYGNYGIGNIPRYQQYTNSTGTYSQFGSPGHQSQQHANQYSGPNPGSSSYNIYNTPQHPSVAGSPIPATSFPSGASIEGSSLTKDPIV